MANTRDTSPGLAAWSRWGKRLTWFSLAMLVVTLAYWAYAFSVAPDFSSIDGTESFGSVSAVFGHTELGWVVERYHVMIWTANDGTGRLLPVLHGRNFIVDYLDPHVWTELLEPSRTRWLPGVYRLNTIGRWPDGTITGHLYCIPILWLVAIFVAAPGLVVGRRLRLRVMQLLRRQRLTRLRRQRAQLGCCACGFDLRHARGVCPECGRRIRWVPIALPVRRRRGARTPAPVGRMIQG